MGRYDEQKKAFAEWLATPPAQRHRLGLPETQKEWGESRGVTARTLSRWKQDGQLARWVEDFREQRREVAVQVPEPDDGLVDEDDPLAREFAEIRRELVNLAREGDKTGLQEYFKWIGQHELERERRARESGLRELSEDELVGEVLSLVGRDRVKVWLEGEGG